MIWFKKKEFDLFNEEQQYKELTFVLTVIVSYENKAPEKPANLNYIFLSLKHFPTFIESFVNRTICAYIRQTINQ